jgi:uncharacterized protein (TIGR00730 family)
MSAVKNKADKAYFNEDFLKSPEARILRLMSEYIEPRARLQRERVKDTIVFFGSARITSREEAKAKKMQVTHSESVIERSGSGSEHVLKQLAESHKLADTRLMLADYYEDAAELARLLTEWSVHVAARDHEKRGRKKAQTAERIPFVSAEAVKTHDYKQRYVICSGGGPGIMEAANKGAMLAGGRSIGFNISLPYEQMPNSYISDELNFEFHYFFMRKFWFAYLGKALVIFPGGFGTIDELFEVLTLIQTGKIKKKMPIVVYGTAFWKKLINWDMFSELGVIDKEDMDLIHFSDSPQEAFEFLKTELERLDEGEETFMRSESR